MILRIKELLKEKGVTTYQLAAHLGVTQPTVSNAMNGNPNVEWLNKVALFLNVPITDLFEQTNGDFRCPNCGTALNISIELAKGKE